MAGLKKYGSFIQTHKEFIYIYLFAIYLSAIYYMITFWQG